MYTPDLADTLNYKKLVLWTTKKYQNLPATYKEQVNIPSKIFHKPKDYLYLLSTNRRKQLKKKAPNTDPT
jgi:hypothetical protein